MFGIVKACEIVVELTGVKSMVVRNYTVDDLGTI